MATRVALLTLVTGTFTALWSGDHPERLAAADRPTPYLVGTHAGFSERHTQWSRPARPVGGLQTGRSPAAEKSSLPLPEGIVEGTYLVTDQTGQTQVRLVAPQENASHDRCLLAKPEDHYVVERNGHRWHYIRLDDSVVNRFSRSSSTQHN
ncbi:hypothetical protein [Schlesneria paludicola]|uniref:hypothetical protein n=1 Tax=Schlesneria paludicola TaxID=360056 RepID=UPI00029B1543|nr:hypothetical protein [Schlesneria paludicola]